jgi:ATP-dependent Clp protease ATP-binding subunit ClpB
MANMNNKNFNRFTVKAQEALQNAQELAASYNHGEFKAVHLLASLINDESSLVVPMLMKAGVNIDDLDHELEHAMKEMPKVFTNTNVGQLYLSQELMQVLEKAAKIALSQKDEFISCEHLLLSIVDTDSTARAILEQMNVRRDQMVKALAGLRGSTRVTDETPESKFQVLEKYAVNLTNKAKEGKLDPVIGRDAEIMRIIQILSRRTKNNPILIGEAGVGKSTLVKYLAKMIISGDAPSVLATNRMIKLEVGKLLSGVTNEGQMAQKIKAAFEEDETPKTSNTIF